MIDLPQKYQEFSNRLTKNLSRIGKIARKRNVECYRIYDLDLPDFPFVIDIYGPCVCVSEYERKHSLSVEEHQEWVKYSKYCMSIVLQKPIQDIYLKERHSIKNRQEQYGKLSEAKKEYTVSEHGLKFIINVSDYLDTGLFLDHRLTRKMVMDEAKDKNVLNLFAYTGTFSVYAAAGGAKSIMTVDLSNTYIQWAQENMKINGLTNDNFQFLTTDVLQNIDFLRPESFDIIILDPPSFSNSKKMKTTFDVQTDHWWLINKCLKLLTPSGKIYFSTNLTKFHLFEDKIDTENIKDITKQTRDFDFERKLNRYCFLISR